MTIISYSERDLTAFIQAVFEPKFRTIVTGGVALDAHPLRRYDTGGYFTRSHDDLNVLVLDEKVDSFITKAKAEGLTEWGVRGNFPIGMCGEFTVELWPYSVDKKANTYTVTGNKSRRSYPLEIIDGQQGRIIDTRFTIAANEQLKYDALHNAARFPEDQRLLERLRIRDDFYDAITDFVKDATASPRIVEFK